MYRTPIHEPRYKQRTRDRESRCKARRYEEQRVSSEASSSEEDEESTDRYTEESEDTTESQQGRGDCDLNTASSSFERGNAFNKRDTRTEDFLMRAYFANERVQKHDKITQKNFLSPFPSFLIPPVYRGGAPLQSCRYPTAGNPREDEDTMNSTRPPRGPPKKSDNFEEENNSAGFTTRDQKSCGKHKSQRETKYFTKSMRPERVLTCTQGKTSLEQSSIMSRNAFAGESSSIISPKMESLRKPRGSFRESKPEELSPECKDCLQCMENRKKGRRSTVAGDNQTEKEPKEPLSGEASPRGALGSIGSGKVREKLVYVVEEEGKDLTKLETDLFSVNEILTIKKDLLELSEFAKKLKRLKEMKRDAERGKADKKGCQCQPVAELLKNVNQRIEALEARQEELERGSHKTSQKGYTETESKKTTDQKTLSDSPPKTPVVRKQSAMRSVPCFSKPEMVISRAGFSNNSEIVNELMDIKNQLHKLEKRRVSRELTPEAAPLGESNIVKKKDHAIAVFSSRTYILTSENYDKSKTQQSVKAEGQVKSTFPISDDLRSRTEQTKENVANWLKSVSPIRERSENEVAVFLEAEKPEREINAAQPGSIGCTDFFNGVESQEPPKNRASEAKSGKPARPNLDAPMKTVSKTRVSNRETPPLTCKECIMTSDGRIFIKKSGNNFANGPNSSSKGAKEIMLRRSASSCSASSPIQSKERIGRMKKIFRDFPTLLASHSKSTQELSGSSGSRKDQKTVRNPKVKNPSSPRREKIHKESKNELFKKRESNMDMLKDFGNGDDPLSSSTFSELIRTINLEKPSLSIDGQDSYRNNMHIYSLATMAKLNLKGFEMKYKDDAVRGRAREKRRREEEAEREAARMEIQKPGCSRRNEPSPIKIVNLCEKEKIEKVEQEVCECVCCCKKKPKVPSDERKDSGNESCSTVDSSCEPPRIHRSRSRESRRRKKKCSSERVMFKKSRDRGKRKRERKKNKLCKVISKEIKRKNSNDSRVCKRRSSGNVCVKKCKSRERRKKKKCEECPKKIPSRRGIFCRQIPCNCQAPPETSTCETESIHSGTYYREGNHLSECLKPTVPMCPQAPSKDSIEVYLKRQRRKAQFEKEKLSDDNCPFRNVLKSLRKYYPKFSNFQLGNCSGEFSDVKASQQQQQSQKYSNNDPTIRGCSGSLCQLRSLEPNDRGHNHRHLRYHNTPFPDHCYEDPCRRQTTKPEHLQSCKCVRVYLQTQGRQEWPGVMPHPKLLSDKSENEISSANSTESKKLIKSDFIFPGRLPQSQYVAHCCEKKPKCKKHKKRKKKCKCCRCPRKKRCKRKNRCVCDKCGNVHKRKKNKKKKCIVKCAPVKRECKKKTEPKPRHVSPPPTPPPPTPPPPTPPPPQIHLPVLSFLRYFCKSKSNPSKTCQNISGASHRTHKKKKPPNEHCLKPQPQKCDSCCTLIDKIQERLENLEKAQHNKGDESCPEGKKEHKKKDPCICCEVKKEHKKKGPCIICCEVKKEHKKKDPCDCCEVKKEPKRDPCDCCEVKKEPKRDPCDCCEVKKEPKRDPCDCCEVKKEPKRDPCDCCEEEKEHTVKDPCDCCELLCSDSDEFLECKRKKKKKKKKKKCCCCPSPQHEVPTYYFTNPISNKPIEPSETFETNESLTTKTTTTTTATTETTATTVTTEDTETSTPSKSLDSQDSKKHCKLRGRLSSLQSLLNSLHRCKKSKPQANNSANVFYVKETGLADDCCPMPRGLIFPELKAEPSGFMDKIKKLKGKKNK